MNRKEAKSRLMFVAIMAFALVLATALTAGAAITQGECRIDWNGDGFVTEADYLVGDPIGGFYAEWYIFQYYPTYYPILFPTGDTSRLDYNADGTTDENDLMGALDAVAPTEGFYVEWYIYMFYPGYYPIFFPEYNCALQNSFTEVDDIRIQSVSPDGSLIGGFDETALRTFVARTVDIVENPTSKAGWEYFGDTTAWGEVLGFSADNNMVAAHISYAPDGVNSKTAVGFYYNRATGVTTYLGLPEAGTPWETGCFYTRIAGISEDGTTIVGDTITAEHTCRYTAYAYDIATATFTLLHAAADGASYARDCNGDGSIVVGSQREMSLNPVKWVRAVDGTYSEVDLYDTAYDSGNDEAWSITEDGNIIAGHLYNTTTYATPAYLWTDSGYTLVGGNGDDSPAAIKAMSNDGTMGIGHHTGGFGIVNSFFWADGQPLQDFDAYIIGQGVPSASVINWSAFTYAPLSMSADGKVMVGKAQSLDYRRGWVAIVDH